MSTVVRGPREKSGSRGGGRRGTEILFDSLDVKPLPEKQVLLCVPEAIAPTRHRGIVFVSCATTTMKRSAKDRRIERQRHGDRYRERRRETETERQNDRERERVCE